METLKKQYESLMNYANQMGFKVIGISQDIGDSINGFQSGLKSVFENAEAYNYNKLLIDSLHYLSRCAESTADFIKTLNKYKINVYTPMSGKIEISENIQNIFCQEIG